MPLSDQQRFDFSKKSQHHARCLFVALRTSSWEAREPLGRALNVLYPRLASFILLPGRQVPEDCSLQEAVEVCPPNGTVLVRGEHEVPGGLILDRPMSLEGIGDSHGHSGSRKRSGKGVRPCAGKNFSSGACIRTIVVARNYAGGAAGQTVQLRNLEFQRTHVRKGASLEEGEARNVLTVEAGVCVQINGCLFHEKHYAMDPMANSDGFAVGYSMGRGNGIVVHNGAKLHAVNSVVKNCGRVGMNLRCTDAQLIECRVEGCKKGIVWAEPRDEEPWNLETSQGKKLPQATLTLTRCKLRDNWEIGLELPPHQAYSSSDRSGRFGCTLNKTSITRSWYPLAQMAVDDWVSSFDACLGLSVDDQTELLEITQEEIDKAEQAAADSGKTQEAAEEAVSSGMEFWSDDFYEPDGQEEEQYYHDHDVHAKKHEKAGKAPAKNPGKVQATDEKPKQASRGGKTHGENHGYADQGSGPVRGEGQGVEKNGIRKVNKSKEWNRNYKSFKRSTKEEAAQ